METSTVNAFQEMVSKLDFSVLTDNFIAVLTLIIPVTIGIAAISKGYNWLRGMVYGA